MLNKFIIIVNAALNEMIIVVHDLSHAKPLGAFKDLGNNTICQSYQILLSNIGKNGHHCLMHVFNGMALEFHFRKNLLFVHLLGKFLHLLIYKECPFEVI